MNTSFRKKPITTTQVGRFRPIWIATCLATYLIVGLALSDVQAACLNPPGDVNGDGVTNVNDVQCNILMNLWSLAGAVDVVPTCLSPSAVPTVLPDHNCDAVINVVDSVLAIRFALKLALDFQLDQNTNQCVDACESDIDHDGEYDYFDCAPHDPAVSPGAPEICNGFDDDCDAVIDEPSAVTVQQSCDDNNVCTGTESCTPYDVMPGVVINEIMIAPTGVPETVGEWFEIYNTGNVALNVNGWTIEDAAGTLHIVAPGGAQFVGPRGYFVFGRSKNPAINGGVLVNYEYTGITLPNLAGTLILRNKAGVILDRVDYNAGTGFPIVAGTTIAVIDANLDNQQATSWKSANLTGVPKGTPRGPNADVHVGFCVEGEPPDCDDDNVCTQDSCVPGDGCTNVGQPGSCNDNNPCTQNDLCSNGTCVGGGAVVCNDNNSCTDDSCDPTTGCVYVANQAACNDDDICTKDDVCSGGSCSGAAVDCGEGNPCIDAFCDPLAGCVNLAISGSCDDGNACTAGEVCTNGFCTGGTAPTCADNNPCTDDGCDPDSGCVFAPNTDSCDDGNGCTENDQCASGVCSGVDTTPTTCNDNNPCTDDGCDPIDGCTYTSNSAPCDDGLPCLLDAVCADGMCVPGSPDPGCTVSPKPACVLAGDMGDVIVCPVKLARITQSAPVPAKVTFTLVYDDTSVEIQSLTDYDCSNPLCLPYDVPPNPLYPTGHPVTSAPAPVSAWSGMATVTIATAPNPTSPVSTAYVSGGVVVGDAEFLTLSVKLLKDVHPNAPLYIGYQSIVAKASNEFPLPGTVMDDTMVVSPADCTFFPGMCEDNSPCTEDICNTITKKCQYNPVNIACDDNSACTDDDTCVNGKCKGTPLSCSDDNPCTDDSCDPVEGCDHVHNTKACTDGNACTAFDKCQDGQCVSGPPAECDDGHDCTADTCEPAVGCVYTPSDDVCDDANECTADTCSPTFGCTTAPIAGACDDNNACTDGDECAGGICLGQSAVDCDDANPCTVDACDPEIGCIHTATAVCDDGNPCTDDDCDVDSGCVYANNTAPCEDGDVCTVGDQCGAGQCLAGNNPDCDDDNVCTDDICLPVIGCLSLANTQACDDGNACTLGDTCGQGVCQPGAPDFACADIPGITCEVSGTAGQVVTCPVKLARATQNTPLPAALQFVVYVDDSTLKPVRFLDEFCLGTLCFPATVPPAPIYPQGHMVTTQPGDVAMWTGGGNVTVTNLSAPTTAITEAYFSNGTLVGDALFMDFEVELLSDVAPGDPVVVVFSNILGAAGDTSLLPGYVLDKVMVVGVADCTTVLDVCDDGNPCTVDNCDADTLACVWSPHVGSCDDGNSCTTQDTCEGTQCSGGPSIDCSDNNPCTDDSCSEASGCVHLANSIECDDNDACTEGDICSSGTCAGTTVVECNDGNPCTDDFCTSDSGCQYAVNIEACTDNNVCTTGDVCENAVCQGGDPINCDDGDDCTTDGCDPITGCFHYPSSDCSCLPNDSFCQIAGNAGQTVECTLRVARGTQASPAPAALQFTVSYDDSLVSVTTFQDVVCVGVGGTEPCFATDTPPSALFPSGHSVTLFPPDPAMWTGSGPIWLSNLTDGTAVLTNAYMDAGSVVGDDAFLTMVLTLNVDIPVTAPTHVSILGGSIVGSTPDAKPMDGELQGCTMVVNPQDCNDFPGVCDDGNSCTTDTCLPNGDCENEVVECDDGDVCNGLESCFVTTGCQNGTPLDCSDADLCTEDVCDPVDGCSNPSVDCDDQSKCTNDSCDPDSGCEHVAVICDDDDPCTEDSCDAEIGCMYTNVDCDDSNPCTNDFCDGGECAYEAVVCTDDGDACTDDTCDPDLGCTYTVIVCDDSDVCTGTESCDPKSGCVPGTPLDCDDNITCTDDQCDPQDGCLYFPNHGVCDDAWACTDDSCAPGVDSDADGCVHEPSPGLSPCTVICSISGLVGNTVECKIRLAEVLGPTSPYPTTALQLDLQYDPALLELTTFHDGEFCPGGPCIPWNIPVPFPQLQSGHAIGLFPSDPTLWMGTGKLLMAHFTDPSTAVTNATINGGTLGDGGNLTGDPVVITAVFKLLQTIPSDLPTVVTAPAIIASDVDGFSIPTLIEYDVIQSLTP